VKAGWTTKRLGELCGIELGKTPARAVAAYWDPDRRTDNVWLSIADLQRAEGKVATDSKEYLSDLGAALCKPVQRGTLMVSFKLTLGRLAFAGRKLFTNEAIASLVILDERLISKEFLYWYLQAFDWHKAGEGEEKIKGVALNKALLRELLVHFPPLPEQRRIVALLDEAFAGLATAAANAERNLDNARELFESHLAEVFSRRGDGWVETTLGSEIDLLSGFAFKSAGYTTSPSGVRLLRGDNIIQGSLRWEDEKRWPAHDVADYARFALLTGDVVLAMDRPWVKAGLKRAQITGQDLPCLLVQRTARLRAGEMMSSRFLYFLLSSDSFVQHIVGVQTGSGVPHISGQQIKDFRFARPPLKAQQDIAAQLDSLSDQAGRLSRLYEEKQAALAALKRSLLHQAFNGEL
jgi:type I restriction enzyme, S subunit